jgi:hypothetical protein
MTVLQKSMADVVAMYEREERHIHPYPPFSIEWAIKKPGYDRALLGIIRRVEGTSDYAYEVWEVGGG